MTVAPRQLAVASQRGKHARIVVAEVAREVLVALEDKTFLRERLLKGLQVQRLAIGNHAVEIKDDGLERGAHAAGALTSWDSGGAFSPAWIAILRRLAGGGYGHSHVGLYAQVGL